MFRHTLIIDDRFAHGTRSRMLGKLLYSNWHNEHIGADRDKNFTTHFIYIRVGYYVFDSSTNNGAISTVVYRVQIESR